MSGSSVKHRVCSVEGCGRDVIARDLCFKHYQRLRLYGDLTRGRDDCIQGIWDVEHIRQKLLARHKADPGSGCWVWTKARHEQGYGEVTIRDGRRRRVYYAHRLSAMVFLGFDISSPLKVCHRCDNPPCINPEHLFIGTNLDNIRDMLSKGREHQRQSHWRKWIEREAIM